MTSFVLGGLGWVWFGSFCMCCCFRVSRLQVDEEKLVDGDDDR